MSLSPSKTNVVFNRTREKRCSLIQTSTRRESSPITQKHQTWGKCFGLPRKRGILCLNVQTKKAKSKSSLFRNISLEQGCVASAGSNTFSRRFREIQGVNPNFGWWPVFSTKKHGSSRTQHLTKGQNISLQKEKCWEVKRNRELRLLPNLNPQLRQGISYGVM